MRASSNILFSFICVFGAITSAIYCSNMIAFFTVSKQMVPFSTSEEMVQQNTYKWGTLGGSLWSDSFSVRVVPLHFRVMDFHVTVRIFLFHVELDHYYLFVNTS